MEIDFSDIQDGELPNVWITAPRFDQTTGKASGRAYINLYRHEDDPYGWEALEYGADYYNEGMQLTDIRDKNKRVEFFRAAELLYLHSAIHGNVQAMTNLGYIYYYDRCNGAYYHAIMSDEPDKSPDELAYTYFKKAADKDSAEACYKLGDMYSAGRGCERNDKDAFFLFERAFKLGQNEEPSIWGSAALRLANCYENGTGCKHDFSQALNWYAKAETGLEITVRSGNSYYSKRLSEANAGKKRMKQELSGAY
jgi:TPR repeat protein